MSNSIKELKQMMYNLLVEFQNNSDIKNLLSKHKDDTNFEIALEECINKKLVSGLTMDRAADGVGMLSINNPKITSIGLEFIENFTR
ncbi:hypothetical protein [Clostridium neonatale]|uniref:YjcQ protein n=1 Tax=Siphoviridae sp. ct3gT1 TaxID=2825323 RepID=A0A8S5UJC0_9CAUD|nr:conserved hypothetical protein [Clostridium neonatale]DAF94581.1 MAG TPA: hypothetical protein [Siphoviridae sp. ct3gT1]